MPEAWQQLAGRFRSLSDDTPGTEFPPQTPTLKGLHISACRALYIVHTFCMSEARQQRLADFVAWVRENITGDEKGEAQVFLDRLFQAFGQKGCKEVGGTLETRVKKSKEDGGGTAFADYVWKPVVLIEMKKRGADLGQHFRQTFDYWTRLVPDRIEI
jgi:hypothetical protein